MKTQWTFIILFILGGIQAQDTLLQETLLPIEIMESRDQEKEIVRLQRNHFLSYPASFDDPSRLLMKFAGFSPLNDQSNAIIYRGLPPHYTKWNLYGAEIVNPNHLSNAGTISDRTSRSAGGVNMFSGQVIGRMDYTGPSSLSHVGDAVAGISDIQFRRSYRDQYFINLGLIGLEVGIERVNQNSNFLANYRYSTLGVLSGLGVDLGEDNIGYQDAVVNYRKEQFLNGTVNLYGSWGYSKNEHPAIEDQSEWDEIKDLQDIFYDNTIGIIGANYSSENNAFDLTFNYSFKDELRESFPTEGFDLIDPDFFSLNERLLSMSARFKVGYLSIRQLINHRNVGINLSNRENNLMSRTGLLLDLDLTNLIDLQLRTDIVYDQWSDQWSIEPGVRFTYLDWEASVRINSMAISPELYFFSGKQKIDRPGAFNFSLAINKPLRVEGFFHLLYDIPFTEEGDVFYSDLVSQDIGFASNELSGQQAFIYGMNAQYQWDISTSSSLRFNGTLFSNKADGGDDDLYDNPYAFGHILNAQWSKTFTVGDQKYLKLATAFHLRGGERRHLINLMRSQDQGSTVFDYSDPFAERLESYQRMDLRINYVIGSGTGKQVISLDIQNVLSRMNDSYSYFDPYIGTVLTQSQLGIIPILSYRRLW